MEDPFRILGLPRQFDLTPAEVTTAHLRAVSRLHPDRATDEVQRNRMVQEAAVVGDAKQRVAHDLTRAEELLKLLGARSFLAAPLTPEFLMETMELRDAIEEVCAQGQSDARAALSQTIRQRRSDERGALASAFRVALAQSGDPGPGQHTPIASDGGMNKDAEASLRAAAAALVRLRYLDRMLERLASDL